MKFALLVFGLVMSFATLCFVAPSLSVADGDCETHWPFQVTDGHGHDEDGDGIGCAENPHSPDSSSGGRYDRDNWSYDSDAAQAALRCSSSERVDHVVALREAYDSGGSTWSPSRKRRFANDRDNMWCLDAALKRSKSDNDLAAWSGGSCAQRKLVATTTVIIKARYGLSIDQAEEQAVNAAQARVCSGATASNAQSTSPAANDAQTEVRIAARRLADGRIEFALQYRIGDSGWSEPLLAPARFLPVSAAVGRWLFGSALAIP